MLISELLKRYGDIYLSEQILDQLGIKVSKPSDMMLNYKDVKILVKGEPYQIIAKLKLIYGCQYEENLISLSNLCTYYGLDRDGALQKLKGATNG